MAGLWAVTDEIVRKEPPPWSAIALQQWRIAYSAPVSCTSCMACSFSGVRSRSGVLCSKPAQLMAAWKVPKRSSTNATSACTCSSSVMSTVKPVPPTLSANSFTRSVRRAATTTWAPSWARRRVVASPSPLWPPMTMTTLASIKPMSRPSLGYGCGVASGRPARCAASL